MLLLYCYNHFAGNRITHLIKQSMVTNQNRLIPIFRFFLFDKFKGNTLLQNVLKNLVPIMSLYPSFRQLSNRLSLTESLFNGTKPVINPNSATTENCDTNIKRPS